MSREHNTIPATLPSFKNPTGCRTIDEEATTKSLSIPKIGHQFESAKSRNKGHSTHRVSGPMFANKKKILYSFSFSNKLVVDIVVACLFHLLFLPMVGFMLCISKYRFCLHQIMSDFFRDLVIRYKSYR